MMLDKILNFLKKRKKVYISLNELELLFTGKTSYHAFAQEIRELEKKEFISGVKSHGKNGKIPELFNTYRINKAKLNQSLQEKIKKWQLQLHPQINLENYFSLSESQWQKDLPYIKKIDKFLKEKGLPVLEATNPERSFQLVGDEKWLDEKGGKKLLERIGLEKALKLNGIPDPLMLAVNPPMFSKEEHLHLIVENKTTFLVLGEILRETQYTSLIYGAGWKIVGNIANLEKQLGLQYKKHYLEYFGDLDYEGIKIWYLLNEKRSARLCLPFYQKLLNKPYSLGKENQLPDSIALEHFLTFFTKGEQEKIKELLKNGGYYPQEALSQIEVQAIGRKLRCPSI